MTSALIERLPNILLLWAKYFLLFLVLSSPMTLSLLRRCEAENAPKPGKLLGGMSVRLEDAKSRCPVPPHLKELAPPSWKCEVSRFEALGGEHKQFFAAWYRRSDLSKQQTPMCSDCSEQIVIYEAGPDSSELQPIWSDIASGFSDSNSVSSVKLTESPAGRFIELEYYTGGTAGSWTEYLAELPGARWGVLEQAILSDIQKCIPKSFGIQAVKIDLQKLQAEVFAGTANDPNCCPSGHASLDLELKGEYLHAKKCAFSKQGK